MERCRLSLEAPSTVGITASEPASAFDYTPNSRIDFADVVWLFTHL